MPHPPGLVSGFDRLVSKGAHDATSDPFDLARFVEAQAGTYAQALAELRAGRKRSHWMWFVFPQFEGLGYSATSRRYAIKSLAEAAEYIQHALLGHRLVECAEAVNRIEGRSAHEIFGSPDDMKFRSSMTLFERVAGASPVFCAALEKYFSGERDPATLERLQNATS